MRHDQFEWLPYNTFNEDPNAYIHSNIWSTNTAIVCFHMVEWHHADRVMLQYGFVQDKPLPPKDMSDMHHIKMQGQNDLDWEVYHRDAIDQWNDRYNRCVVGRMKYGEPAHSDEYKRWFQRKSVPFLSDNQHLRDPRLFLLDVGVDTSEDEQAVPPPPKTQAERRERNKAQRQRAARTQKTPQTIHEPQEFVPHRHSISHSQPFQDPYGQTSSHTPFQQTPQTIHEQQEYVHHRHSISHSQPFQFQYGQSSPHTPFQNTTQTFHQPQEYVPHRHSVSHSQPVQSPFQQYTSLQDPYRHSTSERDANEFDEFLGFQHGSAEAYDQLRFLQQQLAPGSSSTVPEFIPEQPPSIPTEEEHQPPIRRSKRSTKPTKCGTGGHKRH